MKPREELNSIDRAAIHEAGHVAACIILELEFDTVYLEPSKDRPGLVSKLVKRADIDYSSGVLTPEEEVLSTNLVIAAFAGPACDALHRGRATFDFTEYEDLDEVLDTIEYRFPNNNVRIAFTHYCEAESFALFEDDRRLWRFTHVLARELSKQRKLTYAQVTDLYSKEYLVESWVRKEVDEIRRDDEVEKEGSLAASYEQRAVSIEKGPKEQETKQKGQDSRPKQDTRRKGQEGRGKERGGEARGEQKPQDREAPKPAAAVLAVPEGEPEEGSAAQQERRGRRRRRGRGRGRGKRRETLEQLPGEVIGGQPADEAPGGEARANEPQAAGREREAPKREEIKEPKGQAAGEKPRPRLEKAGQHAQAQGGITAAREGEPRPDGAADAIGTKVQEAGGAAGTGQDLPVAGGESPKPEERVRKQIIKAVKPPVPGEGTAAGPQATEGPAPVVIPPVAEPRPAQQPRPEGQRPVVVSPPAVPQEDQPEAVEPPKRRLAVSGGPKAEGEAVSGGKGTTHPDSIWGDEKLPAPSSKPQAGNKKPQATNPGLQAANEGKKPTKAAKPRTVKAARGQGAVAETPVPVAEVPATRRTKAAKAVAAKASQKKAPEEPKPARAKTAAKAAAPRTTKAAKTPAKAAQPKAAAPVKSARPAPVKKAAPPKGAAAPKKAAAGKNAGGKKK